MTNQSIPLVDLKAQYAAIRPAVDRAVQSVLDSTNFIMGPEVKAFEQAFAAFCKMIGEPGQGMERMAKYVAAVTTVELCAIAINYPCKIG